MAHFLNSVIGNSLLAIYQSYKRSLIVIYDSVDVEIYIESSINSLEPLCLKLAKGNNSSKKLPKYCSAEWGSLNT